jgi:hypothetical protein
LGFGLAAVTLSAASATDVYITPDGSSQGACTGLAHPPSWFNTSSNWGSGAGQIGPGTTVHLCGTFNDANAGDTLLRFQGSGSSGSPITLKFENGANLTNSAYWGGINSGGIQMGGSWQTIDGGTNGLIQNKGNGSSQGGYAHSADSNLIYLNGCTNCVVKNMTLSNAYVHTSQLDGGPPNGAGGIVCANGCSSVTYSGNTAHDGSACYAHNSSKGDSNFTITQNVGYRCNWGLVVAMSNSSASSTNETISSNEFYDGGVWDDNADNNHHNGVIVFDDGSGTTITGLQIYDNYIHGDWGKNVTAWIFLDTNGGHWISPLVFNNVLTDSNSQYGANNGFITAVGDVAHPAQVYNNTIFGNGTGQCINVTIAVSIENNILSTCYQGIYVNSGSILVMSDYNDIYNLKAGNQYPPGTYDVHSTTGNPNLDATGKIQAKSSAIGIGSNLANLNVQKLDSDMAGQVRPAAPTAWDSGAYQFAANGQPTPPSGLSAQVQ